MIHVGIVGATGYTGVELCRLLQQHPEVSGFTLYSMQYAGKSFSEVYPQFINKIDTILEQFNPDAVSADIDVLFLAIPHASSHVYLDKLSAFKDLKIIDLSADFRLDSAADFERYYGVKHQNPDLLGTIAYGIPELYYDDIQGSDIVSNPGCYATSVILGLQPLVKAGLIQGPYIVDAKSGVSGAGRKAKESSLYCEISESFSAYATGKHRHRAEIDMAVGEPVFFSPHLVPMSRGILSSIYVQKKEGVSVKDLKDCLNKAYENKPFVNLMDDSITPDTKYVSGTNNCMLSIRAEDNNNTVVIFSAIDNLIKGAAGQAIQNMNIMCNFEETTGLGHIAMYV
jgi:N-acetyl-gamma-glutamyl-phosphate reductase